MPNEPTQNDPIVAQRELRLARNSRLVILALVAAAAVGLLFNNSAAEEQATKKPAAAQSVALIGPARLLPNGWTITPAGEQVALSDLPLNIVPIDNRHVLVGTSGYNAHELAIVDLVERKKTAVRDEKESWFGLAYDAKSRTARWSGGGGGVTMHQFAVDGNESLLPAAPKAALIEKTVAEPGTKHRFHTGLCYDAPLETLYALSLPTRGKNVSFAWGDADQPLEGTGLVTAYQMKAEGAAAENPPAAPAGQRPYDVVLARNGNLYISDWATAHVSIVEPKQMRAIGRIRVGEHPNQMVCHPTDDRLFVACASSNCVSVIDLRRGVVTETIVTSLFPKAPEGSTPDALAVHPNGKTLYVCNADNNCVAVIDISVADRSQVQGFIPTGWYPTSVAVTPDGKNLLVGVGKGNERPTGNVDREKLAAEARDKPAAAADAPRRVPFTYVGKTMAGALSIIPLPEVDDDEEEEDDDEKDDVLARYTEQVYRNCPYSDKLLTHVSYERPTAIPTRVGDASPIKHVIYIIKENRTYDQVFGDLPQGNGDPQLVMFPRRVSPNHHKLAEEYVLLDNLYCNGQVSADGHPWSTMAYNTDYISRNWMLTYSKRTGIDDDDEGNLTNSPSGYLWDACARAGLTYRNYGEYGGRVSQPDGTFRIEGRVPGLVGHTCPTYGLPKSKGQQVRDTDRVEVFIEELKDFEKNDNLPSLMILSLGEDHTTGTKPDTYTPEACVASNDVALGRLVEAVSQSKFWPQVAIFVIEDDAQNGPDHVDSHRTVALAISPYVRRKHVDSKQYSTVSMIRTMELILGLPPLSQYDAAALPMFESFTDKPDVAPYEHLPAEIDLNAKNTKLSYGAARSDKMDFSEYDRIDDFELNEILWHAVRGTDAPQPPAVRRAIAYRGAPQPAHPN